MDKEYIQSGQFIHDELVRRCDAALPRIYEIWRKDRAIHPTLLIWPEDSVRTTTGTQFTGVVFTELPLEPEARRERVRVAAETCGAYGLLLTEQLATDVRLIFETEHGTRTWRLPIKEHGDVQVLGRPIVRDNAESIGIRWKKN